MSKNSKPSVAKDVFVYLLVFIVLYIGVVHFISLLWDIIGVQFPDIGQYIWQNPYDSMRNSIASLIVVWPVFLILSRYIVKDLSKYPEKVDLWVRKWLTYLTIFVASLTIIIDLIVLINYFLGGEITSRFILKVLSILLVAAAALGYEFWELKRKPNEGKKELRLMAVASVFVLLTGIIAGFYFVGTPGNARQQNLDTERVGDLQSIQNQAVRYWNQKDVLPKELADMADSLTGFEVPIDPETNVLYEYTVKGDLVFELCATFGQPTPDWQKDRKQEFDYDEFGRQLTGDWTHGAGRTCFKRTIDPELHKTPNSVQ